MQAPLGVYTILVSETFLRSGCADLECQPLSFLNPAAVVLVTELYTQLHRQSASITCPARAGDRQ